MTTIATKPLSAPCAAIAIRLPRSDQANLESIGSDVGAYVRSLCGELKIPATVTIDTTLATLDEHASVNVNGMTVSLTHEDADDLVASVCEAIWRARGELVTPDVVAAERQALSGARQEGEEALAWLIRECVANGFHLGRLRDAVRGQDLSRLDRAGRERLFEDAVGAMGSCAVQLRLAPALHSRWFDDKGKARPAAKGGRTIDDTIQMLRDGLFYELGVLIPLVRVRIDESLTGDRFATTVNDMPMPPHVAIGSKEFLVNDRPNQLALLGFSGRAARNPANGNACSLSAGDDAARKLVESAGYTTWDDWGVVVLQVSADLRRNAGGLMNRALLDLSLDRLRQMFPRLVAEALAQFDETTLTRTLRFLSREEISVRNLRQIFGGLLSVEGASDVDGTRLIVFQGAEVFQYPTRPRRTTEELLPQELAECARVSLKRYISHKFTRGQSTLIVYLLDPEIERLLQQPALAKTDRERILKAVKDEVGALPVSSSSNPVILTMIDGRRRVRELLELDFPTLHALSYQELSPEMNIQPIARISL